MAAGPQSRSGDEVVSLRPMMIDALVRAGAGLEPCAQIVDQPAAGAAEPTAAFVDDVQRQFDFRAAGEGEPRQPAGEDVALDHVQRHVAPAEAAEQELEPSREVGEPPDARGDDAALNVARQFGSGGQHELDVRRQRLVGERAFEAGKRVTAGDDRDEGDASEELGAEIGWGARGQAVDRETRRAVRPSSGPSSPIWT